MFIFRLIAALSILIYPLSASAQSDIYGTTAKFEQTGSYVAIAPNMRDPKLQNHGLRRAVATLVNLPVYNDLIYKGRLSPFSSMFHGTLLDEGAVLTTDILLAIDSYATRGGDEALYDSVVDLLLEDRFETSVGSNREQDREKLKEAKTILEASGYWVNANGDMVDHQTGNPVHLGFFVSTTSSGKSLRLTAHILTTNLEFLGIKTTIVEGPLSEIINYDYDFALVTADQPATGFDLWKQYGSVFANTPYTYNYAGLEHPIVDFLLSRLDNSSDADEFAAVAKGLNHTLINLNYLIPVGWWEFDYSTLPTPPDHRPNAAKSFMTAYDALDESDPKRALAAQKACDYGAKEMCKEGSILSGEVLGKTVLPDWTQFSDRELQIQLISVGYNIGKIDGLIGKKTKSALESVASRFEKISKLKVDPREALVEIYSRCVDPAPPSDYNIEFCKSYAQKTEFAPHNSQISNLSNFGSFMEFVNCGEELFSESEAEYYINNAFTSAMTMHYFNDFLDWALEEALVRIKKDLGEDCSSTSDDIRAFKSAYVLAMNTHMLGQYFTEVRIKESGG